MKKIGNAYFQVEGIPRGVVRGGDRREEGVILFILQQGKYLASISFKHQFSDLDVESGLRAFSEMEEKVAVCGCLQSDSEEGRRLSISADKVSLPDFTDYQV